MKTTLIITGQLRLQENQTPIEKINYHIEKINPDETILFLWENEYKQYKNEIDSLNLQTIIAPENLPIITQKIINNIIIAHNKQSDTKTPYDLNTADINFYHNILKQLFLTQYTFQNIKTKSNVYIKTRYDIIYLNNFQITNLINNFYHEEKPILSTPFGGDYNNLGIGDLITITNNKANEIYKTIYNQYIDLLEKQNCPMNNELFLRLIFKNINQTSVYRFHFLATTQRHYNKQLIYHANKNIFQQHGFDNIGEIIAEDNLYLPNFKIV